MYIMHGNNDDDRAGFDVSVSDLPVCDSDMALSSETTQGIGCQLVVGVLGNFLKVENILIFLKLTNQKTPSTLWASLSVRGTNTSSSEWSENTLFYQENKPAWS